MSKDKVKMKFNRDIYYTDRVKPLYRKGQIYEIADEGKGMINRWLKRGGVIVSETQSAQSPAKTSPAPQAPAAPPVVEPKSDAKKEEKKSDKADDKKAQSTKK